MVKHVRITGADRDKLRAQLRTNYLAGASLRTLVGEYGRSYGFIHRILIEGGDFQLRGRGGRRSRPTAK
jgi:hypothetical protein